jgi:hypothetical protein
MVEYAKTMTMDEEIELLNNLENENFDFDDWAIRRGIDLDMVDEYGISFLQRWWWNYED